MKKNLIFIWILFLCITSFCFAKQKENIDPNSPANILKDFSALRKRVKKNPKDVAALNSIGIIYARTGKTNDAIKLWKYALSIDPKYVHLYNNLGSALKQQKKYDEARKVFQTGLLYEKSYWIYYNLGLLEREDGNLQAAINAFKSSIDLNRDFQAAYLQLAELGYRYEIKGYKQPVNIANILPKENKENNNSVTIGGNKKINSAPKQHKKLTANECYEIISKLNPGPSEKFIALTFDDGPHHTNTPNLLKILKDYHVKATFFVVGERAELYPDVISQIAADGHEIGNHTWNHRNLSKSTLKQAEKTLNKTDEVIKRLTSKGCKLVRPPYGAINKQVRNLLNDHGWHEVMWDVDSRDWENKNSDAVIWRIMKTITPGSIILMHDIHPYSITAMPTIIKTFKDCGYEFITVSELIKRSKNSTMLTHNNLTQTAKTQ